MQRCKECTKLRSDVQEALKPGRKKKKRRNMVDKRGRTRAEKTKERKMGSTRDGKEEKREIKWMTTSAHDWDKNIYRPFCNND